MTVKNIHGSSRSAAAPNQPEDTSQSALRRRAERLSQRSGERAPAAALDERVALRGARPTFPIAAQGSATAPHEWEALVREARARLNAYAPETPERERIGIQDIARAAELTPQQIRLLERHGLVAPSYEASGQKYNRRYTRDQALLVIVAGLLMHARRIRPAQAAMYVLARNAAESTAGREDLSGPDPSLLLSAPATEVGGASGAPGGPELGLLGAAAARVRDVIAARLGLIAVASLLSERDLPAQWVIHAHAASGASDASIPQSTPEARAASSDTDSLLSLAFVRVQPPQVMDTAVEGEHDPFYAFVAPGGEVFRFTPRHHLWHEPREWYACLLPASVGRPDVEVVIGVPLRAQAQPVRTGPASRLASGHLTVRSDIAEVAASLLWAVLHAVPKVIYTARTLARDGAINLQALAQGSVMIAVLWLYAQVLTRICPDMDQCDIIAPHHDLAGDKPVLYLLASSNLEQLRLPTRAMIHSGQLLSGFAFSLAQPCYVEDASISRGMLLSYRSEERARAAAAIPVLYDSVPQACIYLFSRHTTVVFTPVLRRLLEVAVAETAEVLRLHDLAREITSRSTLHIARPHTVEDGSALRQVIRAWVQDLEEQAARGGYDATEADDGTWLASHEDDRRFIAVVIGAELDVQFRDQPEIARWLNGVARRSADSFAQALDAGAIRRRAAPLIPALPEVEGETSSEPPPDFARVFRWVAPGLDDGMAPAVAYVVLAGLDLNRHHIDTLKVMIRDYGLDGGTEAQTASGTAVGKISAWVLDTKRSVVDVAMRSSPAADTEASRWIARIERDFDTCTRLLPQLHRFHYEVTRNGNLDKAIVILKEALSLSASDVYVLRHLMDLYVRTGRLDEALSLADDVAGLDEAWPMKWYCSLGQAHLMLGNAPQALRAFREAIQRDPPHPMPYRLASEACIAQGEFDAAVRYLRTAVAREQLRSAPDTMQIIETTLLMGDALARQGKYDAALATYEDLLVTYPEQAKDHILTNQRILRARWQRRARPERRAARPT